MIARAFVAVLLAVLTLGACIAGWASSAWAESKLSGDLFVTMQSGDVKRGADVLVALVANSPAFVQEWETVNTQYEQEVAPLVTERSGNRLATSGVPRLGDAPAR
jgi:ethanolamine utilization microcompartment shell protein EutL